MPLDNRLVSKDSSFSSIEGIFYLSPSTKDWLIFNELEVDDELVVTREWRLKEKSIAHIMASTPSTERRDLKIMYL